MENKLVTLDEIDSFIYRLLGYIPSSYTFSAKGGEERQINISQYDYEGKNYRCIDLYSRKEPKQFASISKYNKAPYSLRLGKGRHVITVAPFTPEQEKDFKYTIIYGVFHEGTSTVNVVHSDFDTCMTLALDHLSLAVEKL